MGTLPGIDFFPSDPGDIVHSIATGCNDTTLQIALVHLKHILYCDGSAFAYTAAVPTAASCTVDPACGWYEKCSVLSMWMLTGPP